MSMSITLLVQIKKRSKNSIFTDFTNIVNNNNYNKIAGDI